MSRVLYEFIGVDVAKKGSYKKTLSRNEWIFADFVSKKKTLFEIQKGDYFYACLHFKKNRNEIFSTVLAKFHCGLQFFFSR